MLAAIWPFCVCWGQLPPHVKQLGGIPGGKLDGRNCFLNKKGEKETFKASLPQVSLFCANVAFPCDSGSACSSLWADFLKCACTVLGTTES